MAKKKKIEKVTSITTADEYGNAKTIKLTGNTGGYNYNSKTGVSTPAVSSTGNNDVRTIKTNQLDNQQVSNNIRTIKTEDIGKKKNIIDDANVIRKGLKSGIVTGVTGVANAPLYEAQEQIQKGKQIKTQKDLNKETAVSMLRTLFPLANAIMGAKETTEKIGKILKDKNKSTLEKVIGYGLTSVGNEGLDNTYQGAKAALRLAGATNPNIDKKVSDIQSVINKPSEKLQQEVAQEIQDYSQPVQTLTNLGQVVGNMVPSIAATAITKNPNVGRIIMAAGAKGNATKEALKGGADIETANNMGTASGLTEVGTEMMTGGLNIMGKGALDDVAKNFIDKRVGNKTLNFLSKKLFGLVGENAEEITSDIIGTLINKGTIDPNATYTKEDLLNTIVMTTLSTGTLNTLTGGYGRNAYRQNLAEMQESRGNNGGILNSNDNTFSNTNQIREIIEQKNNGQIDAEEANNRIADVQNGTYQQNQNNQAVIQEAQRQFDAINQAEASGQTDSQTANQERQAIINTINQITQPQQETQERVVQETPKQEVKSNDNKAEQVENQAIKVERKKNNVEVGKQYTYSNNGSTARYEVKEIKDDGNVVVEIKSSSDPNLIGKKYSLKGDNKSLTNAQEYKSNIKYEDLSKDLKATRYDKKMYAKAKNTDMDMSEYDRTMEFITPNRAGNYSKQQILSLAEELGKKSKATTGEELKQEAINYWVNKEPYKKTDSKTKYLGMDEFLKAYYKGAGVGTEVETQETTQTETQEPKIEQPKVEEKSKQEKNKSTNSIKEIRKEVEEKTNKTMSKHIETSSKATNTVDDIKNMNYDDIVYDEKTHKASQEQALRELEGKDIDTNINDIHAKFRGTERLTNVDSAKITELMKQTKSLADEAAKNGNDSERNKRMEQFRTLKGDYAVALSESGQFTEYAKVIKELDPETQIDVLKKVIEKEQRRGNKKYEDVKINEELEKKYKEAKTDEERDAIMEEIKDDTARQIKITLVDKANEFRFLSMLGNIKTHGRNIFGNVGMYSLQTFKDGVAAIGEDIYNKTSKNGLETRSKTLKPATKEVSKFVNEKVDSFMTDITNKYNEGRGMKGDLEGRTKKFSDNNIIGKALNKASDINSKALDFEDKFFSSKMTKQAMKGFLTANGIETNADIEAHPELVAQALDYALYKGKEATFHQDSTTAAAIRNLRDKLYTGSGFSKLGGLAIDTTLPFVSTPANIAKNALEYTPIIGFGNINTQLKNAPDNMKANVFIDSISKQFMGGALMAVGAYLASQGLVKGSGDDDKEDKTEASLGNASYSIKLGNSTYDLSWLAPTAIPFFEGVEVFNAFKKANSKGGIKATDTADLIDTMFGTLNPMTDMSVLQSIERVITSITYGGNAVKSAASTTFSSYLQQYFPTLLSQIAQVGDTKQRNTNTGGNVIEKTFDQIKYKIPGARNTLPEKVDVWGNTNKTAGNVPQRMFEAFLSPANRKDYKVDNTTKELERLARETDDTSMLPTVKNKKLRVNGEDHDLKGKDYVDLQKTYGKTAKKNLDKLIKSDAYKNADDNDKKSMVGKLYDYASYKAKENYAKNKGINFDSGNQTSFAMIDAFGIPYEKYVENQVSGNQGASDMLNNLNGAGLSEAQKGAVMNYYDRAYYVNEDELYNTLENSDLSDKQKELIRAKYEENITDKERERYQRADNIGVDYDLYTNFRSFVNKARGESRSGGPTKKQKIINWIQEQELTAQQKQNLYNDYINNQGIFSYYK